MLFFFTFIHKRENTLTTLTLKTAIWWQFSLYLKTDNPRLFKKLMWPNFFWTTWAKSSKISILPFFPKKKHFIEQERNQFYFRTLSIILNKIIFYWIFQLFSSFFLGSWNDMCLLCAPHWVKFIETKWNSFCKSCFGYQKSQSGVWSHLSR